MRIIVVGTSGSGKTTLSKEISLILSIPHVEFDYYRHGPGWTETPDPIFRENLREALSEASWVADGNYSVVRDIVWTRADMMIWLDYSIFMVLWRLFWRTFLRCILRKELWNGNKESIWENFFTRHSILIWALKTHWSGRSDIAEALQQSEYSHIKVLHMESAKDTSKWIRTLG